MRFAIGWPLAIIALLVGCGAPKQADVGGFAILGSSSHATDRGVIVAVRGAERFPGSGVYQGNYGPDRILALLCIRRPPDLHANGSGSSGRVGPDSVDRYDGEECWTSAGGQASLRYVVTAGSRPVAVSIDGKSLFVDVDAGQVVVVSMNHPGTSDIDRAQIPKTGDPPGAFSQAELAVITELLAHNPTNEPLHPVPKP